MKLSELVQEIQEFIALKGNREINGVDLNRLDFSSSAMNLNDVKIVSDGRKSVIQFYHFD